MKFAEHLTAHITPEWRKQYINYEVRHCKVCEQFNEKYVSHGYMYIKQRVLFLAVS